MPNTIFSCQTTIKKAKFLEFGLKNANRATLESMRSNVQHALRTLDFHPIVTQLQSESEVGKFATLAN